MPGGSEPPDKGEGHFPASIISDAFKVLLDDGMEYENINSSCYVNDEQNPVNSDAGKKHKEITSPLTYNSGNGTCLNLSNTESNTSTNNDVNNADEKISLSMVDLTNLIILIFKDLSGSNISSEAHISSIISKLNQIIPSLQ
ncbi:hypothetical protein WA026_015773 [Henosepilachna vigintioctopunctata]|uniref:Uncharacterized protein n=1 Tax=Henosepilachna vigintioctopunctata TaxID=420089 RepID=A0AAW1V1V3_9CUCU